MVDLHNWLTEQYVVGRELSHEEREEIEPEEMSREDLLSLVRDLQSRMQTSADGEDESDETESIDA